MQAEALSMLAEEIHKRGLNVLSYTGFTYEELLNSFDKHPDREKLLMQCDYLIDGRFVLALRSLDLKFRGSSNQRIIDVQKSLETGKVIETNFD